MIKTKSFEDGIVICGSFPEQDVLSKINQYINGNKLSLVIADPPYGNIVSNDWDQVGDDDKKFASWMINWTKCLEDICAPNSALYVWGGVGKPSFRPFYRYLVDVEHDTNYKLANHITWSKKRAYGVQHNYLFTREELAYLILGEDIKKPKMFNVPLLETKRGYSGYDEKYPAKSEFFRRTNVWTDITEIFRGKFHVNQKPEKLYEIPIEIHTTSNEIVLDPFAGSGTCARAARNLNRRFILVEQNEEYFDKIVETLK